jgi:hypothetical protein
MPRVKMTEEERKAARKESNTAAYEKRKADGTANESSAAAYKKRKADGTYEKRKAEIRKHSKTDALTDMYLHKVQGWIVQDRTPS